MRELKSCVDKYLNSKPMRFHTPLHKGKVEEIAEITAKYDVTEVGDFDNLLHQTGVLKRLTEKCEEVFSAKKCFISTQGTSLANLVMMRAIGSLGKVAVLRSCHKSIYNAIDLFGIDAIFIDDFDEWKIGKAVGCEKIKEAFLAGAKSVVLTCPSYYGDMPSLGKIREVCDEFGGVLAVDEAHGTQNYFMRENIQRASDFADIFSGSFHKALPAFTGSAILCVCNEDLIAVSEEGYSLLHSTSPLYMSLLSIEYCVDSVEAFKDEYEKWKVRREWLSEHLQYAGIGEINKGDKTKLVLKFDNASKVSEMLETSGIYAEFNDLNRIVFLLNFADTKDEYEYLLQALKSVKILQNLKDSVVESFGFDFGVNGEQLEQFADEGSDFASVIVKSMEIATAELSVNRVCEYSQVNGAKKEKIKIEDAEGRVSACNFGIYPPCFYLVLRGEEISFDVVSLFAHGVDFFGVEDGMVEVLCE